MMGWWLTGAVVVVVLAGGGLGGVLFLTRRAGDAVSRAAKAGWQPDDVTRLLRWGLVYGLLLLGSLVPWSLLLTPVVVVVDQYSRNVVDRWTSGPDIFRTLALDREEYDEQPLHWRQALAEIHLREGGDAEGLRKLVATLGRRELALVESVARYALAGMLVREVSWSEGDDESAVSARDLIQLEAIGIIESRVPFDHPRIGWITGEPPDDGDVVDWLPGQQYALRLEVAADTQRKLSLIALTDAGRSLVDALRRPTSIRYLCRLRDRLRGRDVSAAVWSIAKEGMDGHFLPVAEIDDVCAMDGSAPQDT